MFIRGAEFCGCEELIEEKVEEIVTERSGPANEFDDEIVICCSANHYKSWKIQLPATHKAWKIALTCDSALLSTSLKLSPQLLTVIEY